MGKINGNYRIIFYYIIRHFYSFFVVVVLFLFSFCLFFFWGEGGSGAFCLFFFLGGGGVIHVCSFVLILVYRPGKSHTCTISIQTKVLSYINLVAYFLTHLQPSPAPDPTPKKRSTSLLVFYIETTGRRDGLVVELRTPEREVGVRSSLRSPCCILEQNTTFRSTSQKVLVLIPRKRWFHPDMTEKLLTGTESLKKQNKY